MSRRTFIEGALAASGAQLMSGCDSRKCVAADRIGVCSWSFRLPFDKVAEEMKKMGLKRIHLALQPFLEGVPSPCDKSSSPSSPKGLSPRGTASSTSSRATPKGRCSPPPSRRYCSPTSWSR